MENTFWTALGASSLAALVTSLGIYVIRRFEQWGRDNIIFFICFAAGVLISVSFLHIIPTAFGMNANAHFFLLAGYLGLHLFNRFVNAFVCDKESDTQYEIGLIPLDQQNRPAPSGSPAVIFRRSPGVCRGHPPSAPG